MRYIILRDDDTNALTPVKFLELLYRPFLVRGLPVNLATIPHVRTDARRADGQPEQFLCGQTSAAPNRLRIGSNPELVGYLRQNPGYHIAQHGYDHTLYEFGRRDRRDIETRLEEGARLLAEAGFPPAQTFVAPYDRFSPSSLRAAARRFPIISTGWFEWRNLPAEWWPAYALKKARHQAHWCPGRTLLLSHPGCLLSRFRPREHLLEDIKRTIAQRRLTVLVTHWWEYFPDGRPDWEFIGLLHRTAEYLAGDPSLRVIPFAALTQSLIPLH